VETSVNSPLILQPVVINQTDLSSFITLHFGVTADGDKHDVLSTDEEEVIPG
jgi:hypothetical protein